MENESEKARVEVLAVVIQAMPLKPGNNVTTRFTQDCDGEKEKQCVRKKNKK